MANTNASTSQEVLEKILSAELPAEGIQETSEQEQPAEVKVDTVIDEDQVIYDSNMWVYGNDFTSEEPVTVQVTLEEVPLSEIGKIESLSRVATYMGIRNPA